MQDLRISLVQGETRWHDPAGNRDYYGGLIAPLAGQTDLKRKPLWGGGSLSTLSGGLGILMGRRFLLYVSSALSPQGKLSGWGISAAFVDPWGKNP